MKTISVSGAKYMDGYRVGLLFSDNKKQLVDFAGSKNSSHPQFNRFKKGREL